MRRGRTAVATIGAGVVIAAALALLPGGAGAQPGTTTTTTAAPADQPVHPKIVGDIAGEAERQGGTVGLVVTLVDADDVPPLVVEHADREYLPGRWLLRRLAGADAVALANELAADDRVANIYPNALDAPGPPPVPAPVPPPPIVTVEQLTFTG